MFIKGFVSGFPGGLYGMQPNPMPSRVLNTFEIPDPIFNLSTYSEITEWVSFFLFEGNGSSHPPHSSTCSQDWEILSSKSALPFPTSLAFSSEVPFLLPLLSNSLKLKGKQLIKQKDRKSKDNLPPNPSSATLHSVCVTHAAKQLPYP